MNELILHIQGLTTRFMTRQGLVTAVDHVHLAVASQETVCVVGESGSGKSVMALSVMGLLPKPHGKITEGVVDFQGRDLTRLSPGEMKQIRGNSDFHDFPGAHDIAQSGVYHRVSDCRSP